MIQLIWAHVLIIQIDYCIVLLVPVQSVYICHFDDSLVPCTVYLGFQYISWTKQKKIHLPCALDCILCSWLMIKMTLVSDTQLYLKPMSALKTDTYVMLTWSEGRPKSWCTVHWECYCSHLEVMCISVLSTFTERWTICWPHIPWMTPCLVIHCSTTVQFQFTLFSLPLQ